MFLFVALRFHNCRKPIVEIKISIKDASSNILRDENKILSERREYFEDLLNPVKATNDDTHEPICFGEEEVESIKQ